MSDGYRVGKADIRKLNMKSSAGKLSVDISKISRMLYFYESIFKPSISSSIEVWDATTLHSAMNITGGEELSIDVGERSEIHRRLETTFVNSKISSQISLKDDMDAYNLSLITPEQLLDATLQVNKGYRKPIHEIVSKVVEEYITPISKKKLIEIEETVGIHSITGNGITPFAFLKQLQREAQSIENPSSIYLFFETIEGYHFVTLDRLYKQSPSHRFVYDASYESIATPGETSRKQNRISHINYNNSGVDLLAGQAGGQYNSTTISFDPLRKSFRTESYDYKKDNANKTVAQNTIDAYLNKPTAIRYLITDSHRADSEYVKSNDSDAATSFRRRESFIHKERAVQQQYGAIRLTISIPGNSNVIAGETVNVIIPEKSDTIEDKTKTDKFFSGKYVASAVAHNINVGNGDYATIIELIRPAYNEKMA